jgi:hypothetical protein
MTRQVPARRIEYAQMATRLGRVVSAARVFPSGVPADQARLPHQAVRKIPDLTGFEGVIMLIRVGGA